MFSYCCLIQEAFLDRLTSPSFMPSRLKATLLFAAVQYYGADHSLFKCSCGFSFPLRPEACLKKGPGLFNCLTYPWHIVQCLEHSRHCLAELRFLYSCQEVPIQARVKKWVRTILAPVLSVARVLGWNGFTWGRGRLGGKEEGGFGLDVHSRCLLPSSPRRSTSWTHRLRNCTRNWKKNSSSAAQTSVAMPGTMAASPVR